MKPVRRFPLVLMLLTSWAARAQNESGLRDLMQARNYAMGGAYRALGLGTEAVDGNPAAMAMRKFYELSAAGAWDLGTHFTYGNVSVLDSQTSPLAAGLSYHFINLDQGTDRRHTHFITLATGFPLADSLLIGVSGHYVLTDGAFHRSGITVDAGLVLRLFDGFSLSVSGHNLVDVKNPDVVRYYVAGFGYSKGAFTLAGDVRGDWESAPSAKFTYAGGFEYVLGGGIPFRAGYSYDSLRDSHFISGGIGLQSDTGGIDFAYRHELKTEGGGRLLALTFRFRI